MKKYKFKLNIIKFAEKIGPNYIWEVQTPSIGIFSNSVDYCLILNLTFIVFELWLINIHNR